MKQFLLIVLFITFVGCTGVNDCRVSPTVSIEQKKEVSSEQSDKEKTSNQSPTELIKDSIENAQPGGQLKCSF